MIEEELKYKREKEKKEIMVVNEGNSIDGNRP